MTLVKLIKSKTCSIEKKKRNRTINNKHNSKEHFKITISFSTSKYLII